MSGHEVTGVPVECAHGRSAVAASCSCGWEGPARHGAMGTRRAQNDAAEHLAEVTA